MTSASLQAIPWFKRCFSSFAANRAKCTEYVSWSRFGNNSYLSSS
jgi:hypothetical protein